MFKCPYYNLNANSYNSFYNENRETKYVRKTMTFEGKGSIYVQPDIAIINIGVVTQNSELRIAQAENIEKSNEVIASLRKMGISDSDIRTQGYIIEPLYDYVEGKQIFKGYKVNNNLNITVRNIDNTGKIIDEAVSSGANAINNITFSHSDPSKYYDRALVMAVGNAMEKAEVVASFLRVEIQKIPYNIVEESYGYSPVLQSSMFKATEGTTPIMTGQIEIVAKVKAIFYY